MQTVTANSFHLHKACLLRPNMEGLPGEFEVVVVGTGLVESMIAAACSRAGHSVLHLDTASYYGGDWAAFTWEGLQGWIKEQREEGSGGEKKVEEGELTDGDKILELAELKSVLNLKEVWHTLERDVVPSEEVENSKKENESEVLDQNPPPTNICSGDLWTKERVESQSRKFNLDLTPRVLLSRGPMVELLISSNISRYTEFKAVTRVLTQIQGQLEQVPSSRADVFNTRHITVVEKRILMKFLTHCLSPDIEQIPETDDRTFLEFLRHHNLTENLIHFVVHAIAMVDPACSLPTGLFSTKKFLTSLGRFGPTPFLWSMYGTGELPQAFCRLCAVYGGIYYLGKSIGGLITSGTRVKSIAIEGGQKISCDQLVLPLSKAPSFLRDSVSDPVIFSRAIFLTTRSILPTEKEQLTFLSLPHLPHPIHLVEVGAGAAACPKGLHVIHASTQGTEIDLRVELETLVGDSLVYSFTFQQIGEKDVKSKLDNLYFAPGPQPEMDFDLAIEQARGIYGQIFPGEEFLPRAPDPEEILLGEEDADVVGQKSEGSVNKSEGECNVNSAESDSLADKPDSA